VLYRTGRRKCTDLGGLFQSMPVTAVCGIIGALAISSFPWTSGFVSKSMISQAAGDQHLSFVWLGLAAASAGVFLHAGIKFPWFVFFQKDSGLRPADPPVSMQMAMLIFAALCIGLGVVPGPLYALLPFAVSYEPYSGAHVVTQLQLLLFSGLAFFVMLQFLQRTLTISLDFDWFYRVFARRLTEMLTPLFTGLITGVEQLAGALASRGGKALRRHHGPRGALARTWPTGSMALWVTIMLLAWLVLYYLP
ncbi:MAG: Na+/H+ antiporter subunit D, partial [Candidatus Accumulibacter meliphilus]